MYLIPDHRGIYNLLMVWLSLGIVAVCTLLNSAQERSGDWNLHIYTAGRAKTKIAVVQIKA